MSHPGSPQGPHESLLLLQSLRSGLNLGSDRLAEAAQHARRQAVILQQRLQKQATRLAAGLSALSREAHSSHQQAAGFCSVSLPNSYPADQSRQNQQRHAKPLADISEWSQSKHAHSSENLPPPSPAHDRHLLSEVSSLRS